MTQSAILFENIHPLADAALLGAGLTIERHNGALEASELHDALRNACVVGIRSRTKMNQKLWKRHPIFWRWGVFALAPIRWI